MPNLDSKSQALLDELKRNLNTHLQAYEKSKFNLESAERDCAYCARKVADSVADLKRFEQEHEL